VSPPSQTGSTRGQHEIGSRGVRAFLCCGDEIATRLARHHTPTRRFLDVNHHENVEESLRNRGLDGEGLDLLARTDSEGVVALVTRG
jgi:hypothetical protein